jgi:hypothetical protein
VPEVRACGRGSWGWGDQGNALWEVGDVSSTGMQLHPSNDGACLGMALDSRPRGHCTLGSITASITCLYCLPWSFLSFFLSLFNCGFFDKSISLDLY